MGGWILLWWGRVYGSIVAILVLARGYPSLGRTPRVEEICGFCHLDQDTGLIRGLWGVCLRGVPRCCLVVSVSACCYLGSAVVLGSSLGLPPSPLTPRGFPLFVSFCVMSSAVGTPAAEASAHASDAAANAPLTLNDLAHAVNLPSEVASGLWEYLEVDPSDLRDMEVASAIPQNVLDENLSSFVTSRNLSAGVSGRISLLFTKLHQSSSTLETSSQEAPPPAHSPVAAVHRSKLSAVLDQADDAPFDRLDPSKRAEFRLNHVRATGGPPPVDREPSPDQLAAMMSRLDRGDSPYADFAIFQPHGRRLAKHHKFDAQMFVDGKLQVRQLKGPSDFAAWKACWDVFRATMICLGVVSPATLDGYERGISLLNDLYPTHWGLIFCADEIIRSERWQSVAEGLVDNKVWPDDRPWDYVIRITTYGGSEASQAMVQWWFTHVQAPVLHGRTPIAFLQKLEGTSLLPMPEGMASSSSSAPPQTGNAPPGRNSNRNKNKRGGQASAPPAPYAPPVHAHNKNKGKGKGKGNGKDNGKKGAKSSGK